MFKTAIVIFMAVLMALQVQAATKNNGMFLADSPQQPKIEEVSPAALEGNTTRLKSAIDNGLNPNQKDADGRSLMMYASYNGQTDTVKMLIEAGADVNATDATGSTSLMYASSGPFADTVVLLIESGAQVDMVDSSEHFSALMWAAAEGQSEIVRILIKNNADTSLTDKDGDTALVFRPAKWPPRHRSDSQRICHPLKSRSGCGCVVYLQCLICSHIYHFF